MMFGRKIRTDQEIHERLDNPTALAVFASDALSSVAYATEEMLTVLLIGGAGLARVRHAGAADARHRRPARDPGVLVPPDDQGVPDAPAAPTSSPTTTSALLPAQVAGVALLTDYILTVAVSVSAGVAAMYSAFPAAYPYRVDRSRSRSSGSSR